MIHRPELAVAVTGLALGTVLALAARWWLAPETTAPPVFASPTPAEDVLEPSPAPTRPPPSAWASPLPEQPVDDLSAFFPDPAQGSGLTLPTALPERVGGAGVDPVEGGAERHPAMTLLEALGADDAAVVRRAAMELYRHHRRDPLVQEQAWLRLDEGYGMTRASWQHVDAMAWLCNILGAADDPRYQALLAEVGRRAPSRKLRRYARKNLR